jgi:SAM-dependent methyltransferase
MCNEACISFAERILKEEDVRGRTVLEVGSLSTTGSVRPSIERLRPRTYVGVDIVPGPGVDEICDAAEIVEKYGAESFDIVLATELLEHVRNWRLIIHNIKTVLKPQGIVLITTRSFGFHYHPNPEDFWRFETDDIERIFSDFGIEALEKDPISPGVFLKARKPEQFREANLSGVALYCLVGNKRLLQVPAIRFVLFRILRRLRKFLSHFVPKRLRSALKGQPPPR